MPELSLSRFFFLDTPRCPHDAPHTDNKPGRATSSSSASASWDSLDCCSLINTINDTNVRGDDVGTPNRHPAKISMQIVTVLQLGTLIGKNPGSVQPSKFTEYSKASSAPSTLEAVYSCPSVGPLLLDSNKSSATYVVLRPLLASWAC